MRKKFISWPVASFFVGVLITIGVGVMGMTPAEFIIAKICFALASIILLVKVGHWLVYLRSRVWVRIVLAVILSGLIVILGVASYLWVNGRQRMFAQRTAERTVPSAQAVSPPVVQLPVPRTQDLGYSRSRKASLNPIEVSLDCALQQLPIVIPAGSIVYLLGLNEAGQLRKEATLQEIANREHFPLQWPDEVRLERERQLLDPGMFAARCDVTNHGSGNLSEVSVPLKTTYGMRDSPRYSNTVVMGPLDRGQTSTFYVLNNCEEETSTFIPHLGLAKVVGEKSVREFNFESKHPHQRGAFGIGPSKENWTQTTCKELVPH